jgi:hypothetical protein
MPLLSNGSCNFAYVAIAAQQRGDIPQDTVKFGDA